ncbi:MAG: polysaccharide deacetylase family protein [Rhodospirillaceae bacterium]
MTLAASPAAEAAQSAVVVMYHRFNEPEHPTTNIRLDQFEQHLAELTSGKYTVLPLSKIVAALKAGERLPEHTVGISIDDAFASAYTFAWPRLKKAGLPFTLFVSTGPVDGKLNGIMTWDQIRELKAGGVEIGHHTVSHGHMADASLQLNQREVDDAKERFKAEIGSVPALFAYPYGEASADIQAMLRDKGFTAAFGQHSGVAHASLGFFYLPRFALNENFGGINRFKLAVNAMAIDVTDITPVDPLVGAANPPAMGFTVKPPAPGGIGRLTCFASNQGPTQVESLGDVRFEIRVSKPFLPGRTRINCTLPGPDGRWYWLGRQFYLRK